MHLVASPCAMMRFAFNSPWCCLYFPELRSILRLGTMTEHLLDPKLRGSMGLNLASRDGAGEL